MSTTGKVTKVTLAQLVRDLIAGTQKHSPNGQFSLGGETFTAAGARQVEVAVNGLGARAGNAALEEIVAAIHEHGAALGLRTDVNVAALATLSVLVEERSRIALSTQKAIVGRHARWRWRTQPC